MTITTILDFFSLSSLLSHLVIIHNPCYSKIKVFNLEFLGGMDKQQTQRLRTLPKIINQSIGHLSELLQLQTSMTKLP